MNPQQKADMEKLALAVRRARQEQALEQAGRMRTEASYNAQVGCKETASVLKKNADAAMRWAADSALSEEDRLIAAGWGGVDGRLIPEHVRRIAREGIGEVPRYTAPPRKKAEGKPVKQTAPSRWFKPGEKPRVLNRRKEEPLPVTHEEILCDCWDDESLLLDEQDD